MCSKEKHFGFFGWYHQDYQGKLNETGWKEEFENRGGLNVVKYNMKQQLCEVEIMTLTTDIILFGEIVEKRLVSIWLRNRWISFVVKFTKDKEGEYVSAFPKTAAPFTLAIRI